MKRYLAGALLLLLMAALLRDGPTAARAVRDGLSLCVRSVIPSLFPFFAAVSCFTDLGLADDLGALLAPVLGPLLGCSGAGASAFLLGLLGGYPVGARAAGQLFRAGSVSRAEAERLLSFCNNCGPAFVIGVAGGTCLGSARLGAWLCAIHAAAAILTAQLSRGRRVPSAAAPVRPPVPPLTTVFFRSVTAAGEAMLRVCSFVVFFMTVLRLLCAHTGLDHPLLLGAVELTGGVLRLSPGRDGFVMAAALLGWGGLCVHCQTAAVLQGTGLSLRPYVTGKLLQAAISAALAIPVSRWLF
jgi:sporulation integral membrane protein YlbJ